ncbi:IS1182 family transposase, partial [Pseudomonas sp. TWI929]|uniref:IS1182 family transposase n=1 Tax=Pseudomonas sp. TWI929 TaxID=3136795 RepID=UPI003207DB87
PAYDPADQLKLYLYGYFQRIRSSRRLEAECQRNIEVILMQSMGLEQFNTHESDARMMRMPKGSRVAYNVQTAVDAEHCLILHHEVTQEGDDRKQLEPMAKTAKAELGQDALTVTADMGYSNGQQFQACEEASITAYVPPNRTSNPGGEALFERQDFTYDADQDRYQCPAGQWLTLKQRYKGDRIYQAAISDCAGCALKAQCTTAKRRYVSRHAQEEAFERMAKRMQLHPEMMERRRSIVEHPFGNLKQWLFGNGRFLLRQLEGTRAEMALAVTAYNLKRAISVLGTKKMMQLMG